MFKRVSFLTEEVNEIESINCTIKSHLATLQYTGHRVSLDAFLEDYLYYLKGKRELIGLRRESSSLDTLRFYR